MVERDSNTDLCRAQDAQQGFALYLHQKSSCTAVDVDGLEGADALFGIHGYRCAGAQRRRPTHLVPGGSSRDFRRAGRDSLDPQGPRQLFGGDLPVTVHQDQQRSSPLILQNDALDDFVQRYSQGTGRNLGTAVLLVLITVDVETYPGLPQYSERSRGGDLDGHQSDGATPRIRVKVSRHLSGMKFHMSAFPTVFAPLRLKRKEERRLRAGHLWVFSNEVDTVATPLKDFEPGQPVVIEANNGKALGTGYVNPRSLIAARIVSRDQHYPFSGSLLVHRIKVALAFRERLYSQPFYRLIYGESDGIPGLVVDRYDDILVAQISTAGIERLQDQLLDALHKVISPRAVLWRNDGPMRALEGLDAYVTTARGQAPEWVELSEHGARFRVEPGKGQKTGWFFDHYDNRETIRRYSAGRRVLDLFCYTGAWGIQAALGGASKVLCSDASSSALEAIRQNADLNGVGDRVETLEGDAFQVLQDLHDAGERFDLVVLDPPAFMKRRKDARSGLQGYRRLNQLAMRVLTRDGILISCSCSQPLPPQQHADLMLAAARHLERSLTIFRQGHQAADHPVHPAIPETAYLTSFAARVLPA